MNKNEPLILKGGASHLQNREMELLIGNLTDVGVYRNIERGTKVTKRDKNFDRNQFFWKDVLMNKVYECQYVKLSNFCLTEWIPQSPGLYHTKDAFYQRKAAMDFVNNFGKIIKGTPNSKRTQIELNPNGKLKMVEGGIGNVRLKAQKIFNTKEEYYILGATSSGVCHEGLPVVVPLDLYREYVEVIKDKGGVRCNITGQVRIIDTDNLPIKYDRQIMKYCVLVEEIEMIRACFFNEIFTSIAISYSDKLKFIDGNPMWSFVSFTPDKLEKELSSSVNWLYDYAQRHTHCLSPIILGDFDEHKEHFDNVKLPIKDLAQGKWDWAVLKEFGKFLKIEINNNIMGDHFSNITNTTIINKSKVIGSFNKVKDQFDEDTASVLATIASIVEESKDKNAGELFDAFNEELEKEEPKKSLLQTFWNGLTTALPVLTMTAGVIEKITKIIG